MSTYSNILLAVDLSEEAEAIAKKAESIATANNAPMHIVHVLEPISFAYSGEIPVDLTPLQTDIQAQAQRRLDTFGEQFQIPDENRYLKLGKPEREIHDLCKQLNIDLVIIGSHGRHGLSLLLGSTANGVLHDSPCDVLAIRVGK